MQDGQYILRRRRVRKTDVQSNTNGGGRGQKKSGSCFICQDTAHWAAQCPLKEQVGGNGGHMGIAARATQEEGFAGVRSQDPRGERWNRAVSGGSAGRWYWQAVL